MLAKLSDPHVRFVCHSRQCYPLAILIFRQFHEIVRRHIIPRVYCRVRPLSAAEAAAGARLCLTLGPPGVHSGRKPDVRLGDQSWPFDGVFGPEAAQVKRGPALATRRENERQSRHELPSVARAIRSSNTLVVRLHSSRLILTRGSLSAPHFPWIACGWRSLSLCAPLGRRTYTWPPSRRWSPNAWRATTRRCVGVSPRTRAWWRLSHLAVAYRAVARLLCASYHMDPKWDFKTTTLWSTASQVVAYGQTGSGKTHTMGAACSVMSSSAASSSAAAAGAAVAGAAALVPINGNIPLANGDALAADDGVIPRALADLFAALDAKRARGDAVNTHVRVSFLEIYNEEARIEASRR